MTVGLSPCKQASSGFKTIKALLTASFFNPAHFFHNTITFIQVFQIKRDTQGHFTNHICTERQTDAVKKIKIMMVCALQEQVGVIIRPGNLREIMRAVLHRSFPVGKGLFETA